MALIFTDFHHRNYIIAYMTRHFFADFWKSVNIRAILTLSLNVAMYLGSRYFFISLIYFKILLKKCLLDSHYKTEIRIFWFFRFWQNPLMFLQGVIACKASWILSTRGEIDNFTQCELNPREVRLMSMILRSLIFLHCAAVDYIILPKTAKI